MTSRTRSVLSRVAVGLLLLLLTGYVIWRSLGGAVGIAESGLPEFPDWPSPSADLSAGGEGEFYFTSYSPYDFDILLHAWPLAVPTTGFGTLVLPEGASADRPVPAVVLVHGSGGIAPGRERRVARTLADAGIAAFVIDYYAPRGITEETGYMSKVLAVTEFDAAADAYGALLLLSTHPAIDGERIGMMGFSYGGMAVRIAMDERVRESYAPEHPGFAAFVDTYGPCFQDWGTTRVNGAPLLTLRGTEDRSNDLTACAEREAELISLGIDVDARIYQGAGHAWESETPRRFFEDSPYVAGCTIRYDEAGHSWIDDVPIVNGDPGDSRAQRVVMRLSSGRAMASCVGSGYLIGRDDETREKATRDFLEFLTRVFRPAAAMGSGGI
ncbi:MAG: dienelactone hydrolase [Deltaproteobacteria bacterium]|nr:dienelactone hydrolase [Deltaproteobacteria bacterium]